MRDRRYPLEALADALGVTVWAACNRLHISGSTYQHYRAHGVNWRTADRLAVAAGLHPALVWPEWLDDGLTVLDEAFFASGWRQAWLWNEQRSAA